MQNRGGPSLIPNGGTLGPDSATGLRMGSKGACSWFGGPEAEGFDEDEGLAFFQSVSDSPHLFRHEQPPNTSGVARHLDAVFYVACRWDYQRTPKEMLRGQTRNALIRENGKEFLAFPAGWDRTKTRIALPDLSPSLLAALGSPPFLFPSPALAFP